MASIIRDDLWLCEDCAIVAVNNDWTGIDDARSADIDSGLARLDKLGHLVPNDARESDHRAFSMLPCHCCQSPLHGPRSRFALLSR